MDKDFLIVSEIFYSIQGEGSFIGTPAVFLRLGGCNLKCGYRGVSSWTCDTLDVWTKGVKKTFSELIEDFKKRFYDCFQKGVHLVITGGEPLLQQDNLVNFIKRIRKEISKDIYIEIETNGTVSVKEGLLEEVNIFNISPKLLNSGEPLNKRQLKINLSSLKDYILKFVITSEEDIKEILCQNLDNRRVYLMPGADTREKLSKLSLILVELCKQHCFNYSHRLHLEIWDKKVGV